MLKMGPYASHIPYAVKHCFYIELDEKVGPRLRDRAAFRPPAAGASSHNLGISLLTVSVVSVIDVFTVYIL